MMRVVVYLIACGAAVKIGVAGDALKRMAALQGANPEPLELLAVIETASREADYELEALLHHTFEADRIRGEWFRRSPEILALISELSGAAPLPGTFAAMRAADPRLDRLAQEAEALARRPSWGTFCREFTYERQFAPRLELLAGWGNRTGPLRTRAEHEVASEGLRKLLPECCGCVHAVRVTA